MAIRSYVAPPDDPNGNAGHTIYTDDQGNFWVDNPPLQPALDPSTGQPITSVPGSNGQFSQPSYASPSAPGATTATPAASGTYTTKNGPKTVDQMKTELTAAGYGGPWDDSSVVAAYGRTTGGAVSGGPGGVSYSSPSAGGFPGGDLSGYLNLGVSDLAERAAVAQAQLALARDQFNRLQLPSLALQQQVANWQNAYQNAALAQQASQFGQTLGLQQQQLGLQQQLGEGDLGFREATAADQQAMARAQLLASLRGPADAFQQQKVLYGLNAQGGSQLADILSGKAAAPLFQAPQAAPVAASLDTLANQMQGLPVDAPRTGAVANDPTAMLLAAARQNLALSTPTNPTAWAGASQRLVNAYNQDPTNRGPAQWAQVLGIPIGQATALYNAASAYHAANPDAAPATDAQIAGWARDLGIGAQQYASPQASGSAGDSAPGFTVNSRQAQPYAAPAAGSSPTTAAAASTAPAGGYASPGGQSGGLPTGGSSGDPMMAGAGGQTGSQQANQFLSAMPGPNKIVARNFYRLPQSSQQFTLGAYEAQGYDPNDVLTEIKNSLPQQSQGTRNYGLVAG